MTGLDPAAIRYAPALGLKPENIKSVKPINASTIEEAKLQAIKNEGSEVIAKGRDGKFYLIELNPKDDMKFTDFQKNLIIKGDDFDVVGVNFVRAKEKAGTLYSPETFKTGKSLSSMVQDTLKEPDKGGFNLADVSFSAQVTDDNGFFKGGKDDIHLNVNADMTIDPPNIGRYINEEYLTPSPGFKVESKLDGKDFKIGMRLDEETKNKIKEKILGNFGKDDKYNIGKDYIDQAISALEEKLTAKFTPAEISSLFAMGTDMQKGTIDKILGLANVNDFKKAFESPYLPNMITDKVAEYAFEKYSDFISSAKDKIKNDYTVNPKDSDNTISKELIRIAGYTTSGSSLNNVKPNVSGSIGSDGKLHVGLDIKTTLSSDDTKPSEQTSNDKLGIKGKFTLTSKFDKKLDKASVNLDANIDTSKMSNAQKVAIAEALGEDGDTVNSLISTGKVSLSTGINADYAQNKLNVRASTFIDELKVKETGTHLKDSSVELNAEYDFKNDKLNVKIPDRATFGKAIIAENYKKDDLTVNKLELTGRYVVSKAELKNAGIPDNIITKVTANAKGMGNVYYTEKSFANMLDKYALASEPNKDELRDKILKACFKQPAFGSGDITLEGKKLSLDFNAVNGNSIRTGINFDGSKGSTQGKVLVRDIAAKSAHIEADLENDNVSGKGKEVRLSGISISSGSSVIAPNEIQVASGDFNLNSQSSSLDLNGQGMSVALAKTKENLKDSNKISAKSGSLHVEYKKDVSVTAKGSDINIDQVSVGKYTVSLNSKGQSEAKINQKGNEVAINVKASKEGFNGVIKDKEGKEFEVSGSVGDIEANLKTDLSKISFKASGENSVFRIKQKGTTAEDKGFDIEVKVPNGVSVEFDKETKTFKMSGADGKEFKTELSMKDYAGKPTGNLNLNLKDSTSIKMGDNYDSCEITTPKQGIVLSLETASETGKSEVKKLDASVNNDTKINIDFKDKNNPKIEVGESGKEVNLKLKYSQVNNKSEKTDIDISADIKGKSGLDIKSNDDKSTGLTLSPSSEGTILKGNISTGSGTISTDGLNISSDKNASVTINKDGIVQGKDIKAKIKGDVTYTSSSTQDKPQNTEKFTLNSEVDIEKLNINKKIIEAEAKFYGDVKVDGNTVSVATLGRASLKADVGKSELSGSVNYEAHAEIKGSYISTSGKISGTYKDNTVSINAENNISVKTGVNSTALFNSKIENFSYKDGNISGKVKLSSLDKSGKPDGKLDTEAEINITKKSDGGYKIEIEKGKILSDDCLKAILSQVSDVIQQPLIADEMTKAGSNPKRLSEIIKTDGYNFIKTSNLQASGRATLDLDKDMKIKSSEFDASIDSVKLRVPALTYTNEKGLALENKQMNDTVFKNVVSVHGNVSTQGRIENGVQKEDKKLDMNVKVDVAQLIEQGVKKVIGDINSPVKVAFDVKKEGDKIALYVNGKKSDVTFGVKDIKISTTPDNKIKIDVNMDSILRGVVEGLGAYGGYKLTHKDKSLKIFTTAPNESNAFDKQAWANIARAFKGDDLSVTYSIPELLEEYAKEEYKEHYKVAKDLDITKDKNISIKDGVIDIPLTKIIKDKTK